MKSEMFGLVGGIIGAAIGIVGGGLATYYSIKNTNGPRERSYVIKLALFCWAILASLIAISVLFVPIEYKSYYGILYLIVLAAVITYGKNKQQKIRESEKNA